MTKKKKMLQFGAGRIGRSFLGQLFSLSGYEVVFVDIDQEIVKEINRKKEYRIVVKQNNIPPAYSRGFIIKRKGNGESICRYDHS
jgi:mannitol-1-phosphate/altronate dehydrogenase